MKKFNYERKAKVLAEQVKFLGGGKMTLQSIVANDGSIPDFARAKLMEMVLQNYL